jgi:hypothetical protein
MTDVVCVSVTPGFSPVLCVAGMQTVSNGLSLTRIRGFGSKGESQKTVKTVPGLVMNSHRAEAR